MSEGPIFVRRRWCSLGLFLLAAAVVSSCRTTSSRVSSAATAGRATEIDPIVDRAAMDPSVSPCDDFYAHACGGWLRETPAAAEPVLRVLAMDGARRAERIRASLEAFARGELHGDPNAQALGDFYASCTHVEAFGEATDAFDVELARIDAVRDRASLARAFGALHRASASGPFTLDVVVGDDENSPARARIQPAPRAVNEPDLYGAPSETTDAHRRALEAELVRSEILIEKDEARARRTVREALAIERALSAEEARDQKASASLRVDRASLARIAPSIAWKEYFEALGIPALTSLEVDRAHLEMVDRLVRTTPLEAWKSYLRWRIFASQLAVAQRHDAETKDGAAALAERCAARVESKMPSALGHALVSSLGEDTKARFAEVVRAVLHTMRLRILKSDWIDEPTREAILPRLGAVDAIVEYADPADVRTPPRMDRSSYVGNMQRLAAEERALSLAAIGAGRGERELLLPAGAIGAKYSWARNQISFGAGILDRPVDEGPSGMPARFAALGEYAGHELTHAFVRTDIRAEDCGEAVRAWSEAARAAFEARARCLVAQFDGYTTPEGDHLDGRRSLDENLADQGGLELAFAAFEAEQADGKIAASAAYSPEQRFFLAFAQAACAREPAGYGARGSENQPHALARYRVIGPLSNMPAFAQAFACKPGDKMVRAEKDQCRLW